MDEKEREPDEELVEDLDPPEHEAEQVKGGHTFLKIDTIDAERPPPPPPRP